MAEPFKNLLNPGSVQHMATALKAAWPAFDAATFTRQAATGMEDLEFKARAMKIATALETTLPEDFEAAAEVLEASLGPPVPVDAAGEPQNIAGLRGGEGLSGWPVWAMGEYVARRGQLAVPRALACLRALTQRFSAEFAIRPFIDRHPATVFPVLDSWTEDPSPHVRRLVSEGSRPRLPWGLRLKALVIDPSPTLPLVRRLQDDGSSYVRRSVANHLNDIAKDHPERVAEWVRVHLAGASPQRIALLRHASRHLVKQGHPPTLAAWSLDAGFQGEIRFDLSTTAVPIGDSLDLIVTLKASGQEPQTLVIDYPVHLRKSNGSLAPKVFKGWKLTLGVGETRVLRKRHAFKVVTTRTLYPGEHRIDVQVNGQVKASARFDLLPAPE